MIIQYQFQKLNGSVLDQRMPVLAEDKSAAGKKIFFSKMIWEETK